MSINGLDRHHWRYSVPFSQPIAGPAIPAGLAVSYAPGATPLVNTLATNGFAGVIVADTPANNTGNIVNTRIEYCSDGPAEVQLNVGGPISVIGTPLTIDANNQWGAAAVGNKVYGRAMTTGVAGSKILAYIRPEGAL